MYFTFLCLQTHYYQPMWTLVGAGLKEFSQTEKPMEWAMPENCDWLIDSLAKMEPERNQVTTAKGDTIKYDFMVVGIGLQLRFDLVKGLTEALENDPRVCSNYSPRYVKKTFPAIENFKGGDAIFTFPNTPIKCAGAPQKIAYLFDDYMRRVRSIYNGQLRIYIYLLCGSILEFSWLSK